MRRILDGLYLASGALAALLILLICGLVALQVLFNLITKAGLFGLNLTILSYADFSGYFLAASSFLGLAYTLTRGGHIRVTLLFTVAGARLRYCLDLSALAAGGGISAAATWYMAALAQQAWRFGDKSAGIVPIPIWTAQVPLALGLLILTIAFADLLVRAVARGESPLPGPERRDAGGPA